MSRLRVFILVILLVWSLTLIYLIKQPYGLIALGSSAILLGSLFIRNRILSWSLSLLAVGGSLFMLIHGSIFHLTNEKTRAHIDRIDTSVHFEKSFEETLKKANKYNRPIFLEFYTAWCKPCLSFAKFTLTDSLVGEAMNKVFISYKVDAEKGEGIYLTKKYEPQGYPTLLILDSEGNTIENVNKNMVPTKDQMLELAQKYSKVD